jgi:hypothetical protein
MEEKIDEKNVEVSTVTRENGFKLMDKDAIAAIVAAL